MARARRGAAQAEPEAEQSQADGVADVAGDVGAGRPNLDEAANRGFRGTHSDFPNVRNAALQRIKELSPQVEAAFDRARAENRAMTPEERSNRMYAMPRLEILAETPQQASKWLVEALDNQQEEILSRTTRDDLQREDIRTNYSEVQILDVDTAAFSQKDTPVAGGALERKSFIPLTLRVSPPFRNFSPEGQKGINEMRGELGLAALEAHPVGEGPKGRSGFPQVDRVDIDIRVSLAEPVRFKVDYVVRKAKVVEEFDRQLVMTGVSDEEAIAFANTPDANGELVKTNNFKLLKGLFGEEETRRNYSAVRDQAPPLAQYFEDMQSGGGKFTAEDHQLAVREAKGLKMAHDASLERGMRLQVNINALSHAASRAAGLSRRGGVVVEAEGKVRIDGQGRMALGHRHALTPQFPLMSGDAVEGMRRGRPLTQDQLQALYHEKQGVATEQARPARRRGVGAGY